VLERDGLPKIDPLMGGRFWPAVHQWFLDRHGLGAELPSGASLPARSRVRIIPFAPDGTPTSMARKRKPFVISGETVVLDAPGQKIVIRPNGAVQQYWRASEAACRRGYVPRNVQLRYDLTTDCGRLELEQRCRIFNSEMLAWLGNPESEKKPVYDGTVAALIRCYQTDKNSPYRGLRQSTGRVYDDWCRTLERAIGKRRVDRLSGQDIRDCFLSLMEPAAPGGAPRVRLAKSCVRSMLSILLNYGAELGCPAALSSPRCSSG